MIWRTDNARSTQRSEQRFAHGHSIRVRRDVRRFDPGAVVGRARSRLGEHSYRILTNNCEHFCAWALRDESRSSQVDRLCRIPRVIRDAIVRTLRSWWEIPSEAT